MTASSESTTQAGEPLGVDNGEGTSTPSNASVESDEHPGSTSRPGPSVADDFNVTDVASSAWDHRAWGWLLIILAVAAALLLVGLGGGAMRPYDEGLYGKLARNALTYGEYLYAVDQDGTLYEPYGKPPLTIILVAGSFHLLGVSLFALRLPFALAMLASIGVAFAWGRKIAGVSTGVSWAGALLFCAASARWGRAACIEPLLVLWLLLGLWAYHESLTRSGRGAVLWSLVCGISLALAFATKQVLVGLAIVPIVVLELWRWSGRAGLLRVLMAVGLPAAVAAAWLGAAVARLGDTAIEIYVRFEVLRRLEGYRSGLVQRSLNEMSTVLGEACEPFPWVLGVVGLVVLVVMRPVARRRADGALLLPLWLLTAVLVFENLSDSMLPWYAYNLVVPLTAGLGLLVGGLLSGSSDDRIAMVRAVGGAVTLAVGALGALALVVSQLDAALVLGVLVVIQWRRGGLGRPRFQAAMVGAAALSFVAGAAVHPRLRTPAQGHEQLMARLAGRQLGAVDVDANTGLTTQNEWGTYYGSGASRVNRPPWKSKSGAGAYVTANIWPTEWQPDGIEVVHAPGVMVLLGDLTRPPWDAGGLEPLLDEGPLTFEAEHLPSQRDYTEVVDPRASGGRARAVVHTRGIERAAFVLGHGPGLHMPAGTYTADFLVRWACGKVDRRAAASVQVLAGRTVVKQQEIKCTGVDPEDYQVVSLDFRLTKKERMEFWVRYQWGELWYDRVVVRRTG